MNIAPSGGNDRPPTVQRSDAEMIRARDERRTLSFTLTSGTTVEGVVRWYDDYSICIADENRDEITVFKHAILHYKTKA
ncbi:MAG: RNA chaperone Hfq [Armatimonadetes bacterium]|nr:RNA chaperone Hfq [Armatimonadota bacterium]